MEALLVPLPKAQGLRKEKSGLMCDSSSNADRGNSLAKVRSIFMFAYVRQMLVAASIATCGLFGFA